MSNDPPGLAPQPVSGNPYYRFTNLVIVYLAKMTDMVQEVFTNLVNVKMRNNLLQARLARGLSQQELADRAETSGQQISRLEKSERRLTMDWVRRLSRALGCTDAEILGLLPAPLDPISVKGAVQLGKYLAEPVWPVDDWYPVIIGEDDRFAGIERFGLVVRDESVNQRYPKGTILICVEVGDLSEPPKAGQRVICHRRNNKGYVEVTCRDLRGADQGAEPDGWLWPLSHDPRHQQQIPIDQAEIVALVTGNFTFE